MRTRNWNGASDTDFGLDGSLVEQGEPTRQEFRRSRAARPAKRRSTRRSSSHPEVGIGGRRNRRFAW
jgi:hypothetical protein